MKSFNQFVTEYKLLAEAKDPNSFVSSASKSIEKKLVKDLVSDYGSDNIKSPKLIEYGIAFKHRDIGGNAEVEKLSETIYTLLPKAFIKIGLTHHAKTPEIDPYGGSRYNGDTIELFTHKDPKKIADALKLVGEMCNIDRDKIGIYCKLDYQFGNDVDKTPQGRILKFRENDKKGPTEKGPQYDTLVKFYKLNKVF